MIKKVISDILKKFGIGIKETEDSCSINNNDDVIMLNEYHMNHIMFSMFSDLSSTYYLYNFLKSVKDGNIASDEYGECLNLTQIKMYSLIDDTHMFKYTHNQYNSSFGDERYQNIFDILYSLNDYDDFTENEMQSDFFKTIPLIEDRKQYLRDLLMNIKMISYENVEEEQENNAPIVPTNQTMYYSNRPSHMPVISNDDTHEQNEQSDTLPEMFLGITNLTQEEFDDIDANDNGIINIEQITDEHENTVLDNNNMPIYVSEDDD